MIENTCSDDSKKTIMKRNVLKGYLDKISFLTENNEKLSSLIIEIKEEKNKKIYAKLKKHFGKLSKQEAIDFINSVLKDTNK